jgi:hypothetical protein
MFDTPESSGIFYFLVFAIIMMVIAWLKRNIVKEQFRMALSKDTFWGSWAGKILKSLGIIVFTILCVVVIPTSLGAKEDTSIKIAAFLILTEVAYIWRPGKCSLDETTSKTAENTDLHSKYKTKRPLTYRFGKWIAGFFRRKRA